MQIVTSLDPTRAAPADTLDSRPRRSTSIASEFRAAGAALVRRMVGLGFALPAE